MQLNAARAQLAEFGIVIALAPRNTLNALQRLDEDEALARLPELLRSTLQVFAAQLGSLGRGIRALERKLIAWHRADEASQRLETIPSMGVLTVTASPPASRTRRHFALAGISQPFLGLVPRQNSTGGKPRLGSISRMGNGYLRRLLVVGATSVVRRGRATTPRQDPGSAHSLPASRQGWSPSSPPTRPHGSRGRSCTAAELIRATSGPDPIRPG
ncbi:transposase [Paracoccus sp. S-4012]|uniref:transposase n=1 Tax=Paracoccus sp. S-4012 TaxID=2665648 RepID=UPI0018A1F093|nr:transposase [Paracoccus sp. S-4012]